MAGVDQHREQLLGEEWVAFRSVDDSGSRRSRDVDAAEKVFDDELRLGSRQRLEVNA